MRKLHWCVTPPSFFSLSFHTHRYQRSTDLLLRKLPFARLVKEVQSQFTTQQYRWQASALLAMQEVRHIDRETD
jgi:hypothetical protein